MTESKPDLVAELSAAIETARRARDRVAELRREVLDRDKERLWSFSHEHIYDTLGDLIAQRGFTECSASRANVEAMLQEEVRRLPFDGARRPLEVKAEATCALTGETVCMIVRIEQDEPACQNLERHDWRLMGDTTFRDERPIKRQLVEGCLKCACRRDTIWPDIRTPGTVEVAYDTHHYPDGMVRRMAIPKDDP